MNDYTTAINFEEQRRFTFVYTRVPKSLRAGDWGDPFGPDAEIRREIPGDGENGPRDN